MMKLTSFWAVTGIVSGKGADLILKYVKKPAEEPACWILWC